MKQKRERLVAIVTILQEETLKYTPPLIDLLIAKYGKDPFLILIATLLSLRSRDVVTWNVVQDLFAIARTPHGIISLSQERLEDIIFKTGFYRQKAAILKQVAEEIEVRFHGKVPMGIDVLLSIKGVGLKTASLVMGMAFDCPAICVDVHVHRISNRLGLITTNTVEESQQELAKLLPESMWNVWNKWLVVWGQNICLPRYPACHRCPLSHLCDQKI